MVVITLKSGSKFGIQSMTVKGEVIDSNGEKVGGHSSFVFQETEIDQLAKIIPIQQIYDGILTNESNESQTLTSEE